VGSQDDYIICEGSCGGVFFYRYEITYLCAGKGTKEEMMGERNLDCVSQENRTYPVMKQGIEMELWS
jgi:hypothetical protein